MRVPGRVYADSKLMELLRDDQSLTQVANVAQLPGILCCSLAMPDIHYGYGFPSGRGGVQRGRWVVSPAASAMTSTAAAG